MYSDMSTWIIASSSPKRNSASVRASSVFPTPDGPRKMNEPVGRFGVLDARARVPDRLRDGDDGRVLADDALVQLVLHADELLRLGLRELEDAGIPVHMETMSAISSSPISGCSSSAWFRQSSSSSFFF